MIRVTSGQVYRIARAGKAARHVRIVRVSKRGHQPVVYYREVTRTGRRKPGEPIRHFPTWDGKAWGMAPGFVLA